MGIDDERPGAALLVPDRLRQHAFDGLAAAVCPADGLDRAELHVFLAEPGVRVGEPDRLAVGRRRVDLGRPIPARADPHPPGPVVGERPRAVAAAGGRRRDHRARLEADPEQTGRGALAGGPEDVSSVRRPDGGRELPVDVLEKHARRSPVEVRQVELVVLRIAGGKRVRGESNGPAVRRPARRSVAAAVLVEEPPLATRRVHHPDVALPRVVGGGIRPGLEGDLPRVGRPVGVADREVALGQAPRLRRLQIVQPEVGHPERLVHHLGVALCLAALLLLFGERVARREQEGGAVRRERERPHRLVVLGDPPRLAAVGVQEVHLRLRVRLLAAGGEERDDGAVGRPRGGVGALRAARELAVAGPVDAYAPDLGDRLEVGVVHVARPEGVDDPRAVRRQRGTADLVDAQRVAGRQDPRGRRVLGRAGTRPYREDEGCAGAGDHLPHSETLHVTSRSGGWREPCRRGGRAGRADRLAGQSPASSS